MSGVDQLDAFGGIAKLPRNRLRMQVPPAAMTTRALPAMPALGRQSGAKPSFVSKSLIGPTSRRSLQPNIRIPAITVVV